MRYSYLLVFAVATFLTGVASAQPVPKPADDASTIGAYFKLEVLGWLRIWEPLDADPKTLQVYSRGTGVELGADGGFNLIRGFELFLGSDPEFVKTAKQFNRKWVVVEGDLAIVHGPAQLLFGTGFEDLGRTEYSHPRPRYVIKVRRLTAAPAGVPNEKREPYIKIEVRGVLDTQGRNPALADMSANKASPGTVVRSDQCNICLFLGKDDKWLARAKELNGKAAVARGELIDVGRDRPNGRPVGIVPLPYYLLNVSDLQLAPGKEQKKE